MEGKNKFVGIAFFVIALVFLSSGVQAAWWNPWPCTHDCELNQLKCMPGGERAYICGDYDTLWDSDACYEWPPEGPLDNTQACPYGCAVRPGTGDACPTSDPCAGIGCIPGQTRCGRKCPEGLSCIDPAQYVDSVQTCKKIDIGGIVFDCYGWGYDWTNQVECCDECGCVAGVCGTPEQRDCSTCVPGITKCDASNYYIIECVDKNQDDCYHWEQDQVDWYHCPNGCARDYDIDGLAYCMDEGGEVICDECLWGDQRCNPNNNDYVQYCLLKDSAGCSRWKTDYSEFITGGHIDWHITYGLYCHFGCHLGSCRPNPDSDVPLIDACIEGQTRCGGDGSYMVYCEYDGTNWVWGQRAKCLSGMCMNGECVEVGEQGYAFGVIGVPDRLEPYYIGGMATDGKYLYINALVWNDTYSIFDTNLLTLDMNGSYFADCYPNQTMLGIGIIFNSLYGAQSNTTYTLTNYKCDPISNFTITTPCGAGFTSNDTHFFCINGTNGVSVYELDSGVVIPDASICLTYRPGAFSYDCLVGQTDIFYYENKIYFTNEFLGRPYEESNIEIYGTDGYFFGNFTIDIPTGFNYDDYLGLAISNEKIYVLWAKTVATMKQNFVDYVIQVIYLNRICQDTCHEGGSHCVGLNKEYVSHCIQTPDGCWKYFDEVGHLFPTGTADDYQEYCGATQCKEKWYNHYILKAYCDDDVSCEDICEPDEWGCDINVGAGIAAPGMSGSQYKVKCILKESPLTLTMIDGTLVHNLGRECYGWADPYDRLTNTSYYEYCGSDRVCSNGVCVAARDICSENESSCYGDTVVTCTKINDRWRWSFPNDITLSTFCDWGCNESFNVTTLKRFATCRNATTMDVTVSNTKAAMYEFESWWLVLWPNTDPLSQLFITLILMVTAFIILRNGGWELASGGALIILIGSLATGWLGTIFLFAILLIVGLIVLPKYLGRLKT